jgi:glutathione S-transferase
MHEIIRERPLGRRIRRNAQRLFQFARCPAHEPQGPLARLHTYDVVVDAAAKAYCERILALSLMREWTAAAKAEPDDLEELDAEY